MSFDPRHWNLSTLFFAAAACTPDGPADTTSTGTDDSSTDSTDSNSDYSDGPNFECYSEQECPDEEACISLYCRTYVIPDECELPTFVEVPLPELPDFASATFTDIDGDGDDELLFRRSDGVVVLNDDDSVITTTWPMPLPDAPQDMVPLSLDDDGAMDLVVFSYSGEALVARGDGAGGFMLVGSILDLPRLESPQAIDLDLDGVDEVVAVDFNPSQAVLFDDLLGLSNLSIPLDDTGLEYTDDILVLQADADTTPDVLLDGQCRAKLLYGPDLSAADFLSDPVSPQGHCAWRAVAFADGEPERAFALMDMNAGPQGFGWLQRWQLPDATYQYIQLPEAYTSATVVGPTPSASASVLVHGAGEASLLWDWADDGSVCRASLSSLDPGSSAFVAGQRSAGTRDILIHGNGEPRLWSLPM